MSESSLSVSLVQRRRPGRRRGRSPRSESSSDSFFLRRRNARKRVVDESSDSGSEVGTPRRRRRGSDTKFVIESDSASDPGAFEDDCTCPICLDQLQEESLKGRLESCDHTFCAECIVEWSKNNTSCALCRQAFSKILIILGSDVLEEMPVPSVCPEANEAEQYLYDVVCRYCFRSDHEDTLLLCDRCDDAYHCACLMPPLMSVPEGQWFCPECI